MGMSGFLGAKGIVSPLRAMAAHGLKMSGFFVGAQGISEPPSGYYRPWVKDVRLLCGCPGQGISEPPSGYGRPWVKDVGLLCGCPGN